MQELPGSVKVYFDGGLRELAKVSGYPVTSIQHCSQFQKMNQFLCEVWESYLELWIFTSQDSLI